MANYYKKKIFYFVGCGQLILCNIVEIYFLRSNSNAFFFSLDLGNLERQDIPLITRLQYYI